MKFTEKTESAFGGFQILLGAVVSLFTIGLLVMVFSLMGGSLMGATTDATAIGVINDTSQAIVGVVDYFPLFIVIAAMVVLILLVVVIVVAIRGTGAMSQSAM